MATKQLKLTPYREPSFIIIGAQKCGTTTMYHNLLQHPQVQPAGKKEIHYFDVHYEKGLDWYRSFFPPVGLFKNVITGEASPSYFFLPFVPERVCKAFPDIKLILLLRNPVDRAYSQYQHNVRNHNLKEPFEKALASAIKMTAKCTDASFCDPIFINDYKRTSYLARGIYIQQLEHWLKHFAPEQLLILKSEDFFEFPGQALDRVFAFLGLETYSLKHWVNKNMYGYPAMKSSIRAELNAYFRPFNQRLYDFLGVDFNWG